MKLEGLERGARLVTTSGDIVELIEVAGGGSSARVRYVESLMGAGVKAGDEATLYPEDIATVEGTRFVGPGRTASSSGPR